MKNGNHSNLSMWIKSKTKLHRYQKSHRFFYWSTGDIRLSKMIAFVKLLFYFAFRIQLSVTWPEAQHNSIRPIQYNSSWLAHHNSIISVSHNSIRPVQYNSVQPYQRNSIDSFSITSLYLFYIAPFGPFSITPSRPCQDDYSICHSRPVDVRPACCLPCWAPSRLPLVNPGA